MTRPSALWRAILRVERFLPKVPPAVAAGAKATQTRRYRIPVALMVLFVINLGNLVRDRADIARTWPGWRTAISDMLLVVMGAILVATLAFGVHAWRKGQRHA